MPLPIRSRNTSIKEEFSRLPHLGLDNDRVLATLACTQCTHGIRKAMITLSVYSAEQIQRYKHATDWFPAALVGSLIDLVAHRYHCSYKVAHIITPNDFQDTARRPDLPEGAEKLALYANVDAHFALLVMDLETKVIHVADGFCLDPWTWRQHLECVFSRFNLLEEGKTTGSSLDTPKFYDEPPKKGTNWILIHSSGTRQRDLYNCGPIACYAAWQLFSGTPDGNRTNGGKRKFVMSKYEELVKPISEQGKLRVRRSNDFIGMYNESEEAVAPPAVLLDEEDELDASECRTMQETVTRKKQAAATLNALQQEKTQKQNEKFGRRFDKSVKNRNLQAGDIVTVVAPKNARYRGNPFPLLGLIYNFTKNGNPYIVTERGVIGQSKKKPLSVKQNQFQAVRNQNIALSEKMESYKNWIMSSGYQPGVLFFPEGQKEAAIAQPLAALQRLHVGESHQSAHKCTCKNMCKSSNCKCRIYSTVCGPKCKCKGECDHTKKLKGDAISV